MQWQFGDYRLDSDNECLWHDGQRLTLRPKTFELLRYLLQHPDQLISKEALMEAIWPDTVVVEGVLTTSIGELRKLFGETARESQYIATVHRRGYRFIKPITVVNDAARTQPEHSASLPAKASTLTSTSNQELLIIGRTAELAELNRVWQSISEAAEAVVVIWGEAGIGKTQLANAFRAQLSSDNVSTVQAKCIEAAGELAYVSLLKWLRAPTHWNRILQLDEVWLGELARLMPEILIERPELSERAQHTELQRRVVFEALTQAVAAIPAPRMLQLDDLQWCDQSTLDWLMYFLNSAFARDTLFVLTGRPEEVDSSHFVHQILSSLRERGAVFELTLNAFGLDETRQLAQALDTEPDGATNIESLYQETAGVPLFVVETIRAGFNTDSVASGGVYNKRVKRLPARIQALIESRLARLSQENQYLVEIIAVHGRPLAIELLGLVADRDENAILSGLEELWQKGIIIDNETGHYDFSHDRIRDVALNVLSSVKKRQLHRKLALALGQLHAANPQTIAGELALHCHQAGMLDEAIEHYMTAGQMNHRMCAFADATNHLKQGLELLRTRPSSEARARLEAEFWLNLSFSYFQSEGSHSGLFQHATRTSYQLFQSLQLEESAGEALAGVFLAELRLGHITEAHQNALSLREIANRYRTDRLELMAYEALACTTFFRGELEDSLDNLDALAASIEIAPQSDINIGWFDPQVQVSCFSAHVHWLLGRPDYALQLCRQGQRDAQQSGDIYQRVLSGVYQTLLHQLRGEPEALVTTAVQARELGEQYNLAYYVHWAYMLEAWADAQQTPSTATIANLRNTIETFESTGARLRLCYFWSLLVPLLIREQCYSDAEQVLTHSWAMARENDEHWWDAELERLQGWLIFKRDGDIAAASNRYQHALEIARTQHSSSLELRTLCDLVEHGNEVGGSSSWCSQLELVIGRFSEGWQSADLQRAQALVARTEHD